MDLKKKKILIISPHPDDEAIGCGGLIAKAKDAGSSVYVFYLAAGPCRQLVTGNTDENTRLKEAKDAAKFGGFNHSFAYVGNEFMRLDSLPSKELIDKIEDKIYELKPDIMCIPARNSYDQDHRAVFDACITALRPTPRKVRHFVKIVLGYEEPYIWTVALLEKPSLFLDISDCLDRKLKLLAQHKTQNRDDPFPRSKENLTRLAKLRGSEVGIPAAEAYIVHRYCV